MSNDETKASLGVVGTGVMGRGIIQLFAQAGHRVSFFDTRPDAVNEAADFVAGMIRRQVDKGKLSSDTAATVLENLVPCAELRMLADCAVVFEAIVEDLDVKQALFRELEEALAGDAILASNTSSLLISDIAAGCQRPQRVAGVHFFNPVPLMKVAEIVPAVRTDPVVVERLVDVVSGAGHRAVVAQDQPGFLVNHAGRGFSTEALRILEEGVAAPVDVDRIMRDAMGFRMGPFELLDLTGLDVSGKVMQSVYDQFHQEPRFRPSSLVPPRLAAGLLGRKTGEGFYRYKDGKRIDPQAPSPPAVGGAKVWLDPAAEGRMALAELFTAAGANLVEEPSHPEAALVFSFWGDDLTQVCTAARLDASRAVALDPLTPLELPRTLMLSPVTRPRFRDAVHALLAVDGVATVVVNDSPGFVAQRILATIVNIACNIAQRGIASVADIEDAVRLGLGYPYGPLSWGDRIGGATVLRILQRMQSLTGDPRYRPSPWLKRRAQLDVSLTTAEVPRH